MKPLSTPADIERHLADHRLALLYIKAPHCGVCHAVQPKVARLLQDWPQVAAATADIAEMPEMAGRFHALTVPLVMLFADGKEVWRAARFIRLQELQDALAIWVRQI
ncbi:thioredoxin family protein [Uruburuella testudinis]|uniref:Thioredoxin family protein n=1 Tax=Uruburuella testudinis TaxID=1282863 RepID=A0ABY4DQP4_9NEIS|nr:thioredoxin family protein [Uruburuella testudinis]UOO81355.1 thioredoxin family protein [Uruburuella testudinis]